MSGDRRSGDDLKTLSELKFQIGDFMDIAVQNMM